MANGLLEQYKWTKGFDSQKIAGGIRVALASFGGCTPSTPSNAVTLINRLAADARVTDIRSMAYMLATASYESRETQTIEVPRLKNNKPVANKATGKPETRKVSLWDVYQPINESGRGAGKRYFAAVKVEKDGDAAILTEQDGDRFKVLASGVFRERADKAGSAAGGVVHAKYIEGVGTEQAYFGRGLVQLTWWYNYATASVAIGKGLDLLFNPERALDFGTAYAVLIAGMIHGKSYANGHRCSDYFTNSTTNYLGARAMINGSDKAKTFADIALAFEALLLDARIKD